MFFVLKKFSTLMRALSSLAICFVLFLVHGLTMDTPVRAQINVLKPGTGVGEDVAGLMDQLFKDPTNLQLNFQVMQAQISEGNLEGAEATLDRVLIIDPDSTLAKILIADIKIKLGKFTSARLILDQLIQDPATPSQTRNRAEELAAQINQAIDPVKVRGGYAVYAGVTGNAYGRSDEEQILFGDFAFNNTTKKGDDDFSGFFAYVTTSRELDLQTPTMFEYGASVNGRNTHDPALSDTVTVTVNAALKRNGDHIMTAGGSAGYSEVNNNEFSRNIGAFATYTLPVHDFVNITQSITANSTVYYDFPDISGNKDKTNNAVSLTTKFSRPTALALFELSLSAGRTYAKGDIYDFNHEKAELRVLTLYQGFSISALASKQWLRYQTADTFISAQTQKTTTDEASLNFRYAQGLQTDDVNYIPFLKISAKDSDSNIPNYRREGSEVSMGVEGSF